MFALPSSPGCAAAGGGLRFPPVVNQTMNTARNSATPASSSIHSISPCLRQFAIATVTLLVAACITPPPPPSRPPAVPPAMQLRPTAFADLPGWNDDAQQDAWPSFNASCNVLLARPGSAAIWDAACTSATALDGRRARTARTFFAQHFHVSQRPAARGAPKAPGTRYS